MTTFDFGVAFIVFGLGLCIYAYNTKPGMQIAITHADGETALNIGATSHGATQYGETHGKDSPVINIGK
jgi:hypothetical protein